MFHKIQFRLTLLCAGTTIFIMAVMSLLFLFISERGLHKNQFQSFQSDMKNFIASLEQQEIITHQWLIQSEHTNGHMIYLTDNDVPLLYNSLSSPADDAATSAAQRKRAALIGEALSKAPEASLLQAAGDPSLSYGDTKTYHLEYSFKSQFDQEEYYHCLAKIVRGENVLRIVVIKSLDGLRKQITDQRILFLLLNLFSFLILTLFSWFFILRLLKPIERNQKSQTEFVSAASHELRTPLAVILSCAERYQKAPPDKRDLLVTSIQSESMRMSRLFNDMLTLTQSDSHRFTLQSKETELDTLLLNTAEAFESLALKYKNTLSVRLPDYALPRCSCDPDRISQVLAILLHNAICYTPPGGHIGLAVEKKGKYFVLSVSDDGPGIPEEKKEKIFERFYRIDKTRSAKGHFGLGLCIAYEIVKSHQGLIKITDAPGGGALFGVYLPAAPTSPFSIG